jgi:3-oxoacyl-[acyl-carrier-protein] synthase II
MKRRRVVVTGMGVITPIGNDVDSFWKSLLEGRSGTGTITRFDVSKFPTRIAAGIKGFDPCAVIDRKEVRRMDLYTQYAMYAAQEAMIDSGFGDGVLDDERFGVIIGSGIGGISTFEDQMTTYLTKGVDRVSPFFITMMIPDIASGRVSIRYGLWT